MSEDADPRDEIAAGVKQRMQVQARENQEATVARRFLKRFAPGISVPTLMREMEQQTLTLDMLPKFLDNLPIQFAADSVRYLDGILATDLLAGNLTATPLWRAYVLAVERRGIDLRRTFFGLVTPWHGAGGMVLHNWTRHDEVVDRGKSYGRFLLMSSKHNLTPMMYSLEPLTALMDALERAGVQPRND